VRADAVGCKHSWGDEKIGDVVSLVRRTGLNYCSRVVEHDANLAHNDAAYRYHAEVGARWRRWLWILAILVLASAVAAGVPSIRGRILRSAGWALVLHDKPIESADIIVVSTGADGAGTLEAADLVHSGVATRVAVFADPPSDVVDFEFIRRGIPYEDAAARSTRQLRSLGVETIEQIPRAVAGSEDEGQVLPEWCDQHGFRSIVVVTTSDHSRRLWRILHRSMKGHRTSVAIWPARYSTFEPDRWWETHDGIRTEVAEFEKLLLDVARHPIS